MAKFKYNVIPSVAEEVYLHHTNKNIYDILGKNLDLTKITFIVEAENEEQSEKIRMAVTDLRMWELIKDSENNGL